MRQIDNVALHLLRSVNVLFIYNFFERETKSIR